MNNSNVVPNVVFVNCNETKEAVDDSDEANEAIQKINLFWPQVIDEMKRIKSVEPGNQLLPLARIKKIMKLDEDVKMISAEAPLLFAKAAEMFIQELTLRAWVHTEQNKRRTLQRNDIAMAITKYDMFDFLVDIVPRDEIKPKANSSGSSESVGHDMPSLPSTSNTSAPSTSSASAPTSSVVIVKDDSLVDSKPVAMVNDQIQYYIQMAQQQQQQQQQQAIVNTGNLANQMSQISQQPTLGSNIILAGPNIIQQQPQVMTLGNANQMQMQLVQLPSGDVAQIPIHLNQQQLQQICRQMQIQQQPQQQPIIIQQPTMQPTIIQSPGNNIFLTQQQLQQLQNQQNQQSQQVQQQQHQIQLQNQNKQE